MSDKSILGIPLGETECSFLIGGIMGLFDEVKENVTVRQAAEFYGFKITKSGLISCIFHNDKTPSMKVDRRYYCFGCGVTGDVIDFTAQLFGLSLKEAALKLADDFGIQISRVDRRKIKKPRKILKSKSEKNLVKSEEQEYIECVRAMLDYRILLQKWKKEFAPKSPEEEWDEKFVEALKYLTIVEYYLDLLLFGEEEEKVQVVEMIKKEVEKIDRRCRKNG